jgi:hypothetical protein
VVFRRLEKMDAEIPVSVINLLVVDNILPDLNKGLLKLILLVVILVILLEEEKLIFLLRLILLIFIALRKFGLLSVWILEAAI